MCSRASLLAFEYEPRATASVTFSSLIPLPKPIATPFSEFTSMPLPKAIDLTPFAEVAV